MSQWSTNPFSPLANQDEDDQHNDDSPSYAIGNAKGLADVLTVSSGSSQAESFIAKHSHDAKPNSKKKKPKARKKQRQITVKLPKNSPIPVSPEGRDKEIA
jgi:hypothetical protein